MKITSQGYSSSARSTFWRSDRGCLRMRRKSAHCSEIDPVNPFFRRVQLMTGIRTRSELPSEIRVYVKPSSRRTGDTAEDRFDRPLAAGAFCCCPGQEFRPEAPAKDTRVSFLAPPSA